MNKWLPPSKDGHYSVAVPPGSTRPGADAVEPVEGELSDRVVTLPNVISAVRILLIPVLVALILYWDAPGWALGLLVVLGVSDWVDGKIARMWDLRSKLGEMLDPIADRLLIALVPIVFAIAGYVPLWVVFVLLSRDLVTSIVVYRSRRRGFRATVLYLGKAATFALFWSFPLLLAAEAGVPGHVAFRIIGEACLYWGVGLYVWSGVLYVWQGFRVALEPRV